MISLPIKSLQHPIVKELVAIRTQKKARMRTKRVLISGHKMIRELGPIDTLVTTDLKQSLPKANQTYLVSEAVLKKITGLKQPEGLAATIAIPKPADLSQKTRILVLDHLSDPGNLGTLLRTACAFGYEGAYLINGVDPFNDKALRSAKGATFHLPLTCGTTEDFLLFCKNSSMQIYAGTLNGKPLETARPCLPFAVLVGNEARGVTPEIMQHCQGLSIPMSCHVDSLNVATAGGILLYVMETRRLR